MFLNICPGVNSDIKIHGRNRWQKLVNFEYSKFMPTLVNLTIGFIWEWILKPPLVTTVNTYLKLIIKIFCKK